MNRVLRNKMMTLRSVDMYVNDYFCLLRLIYITCARMHVNAAQFMTRHHFWQADHLRLIGSGWFDNWSTVLIVTNMKLGQLHDNVIKWKHFPRYLPFVRGIHRSPANYPHKGQWRGALMFSLVYAWINGWVKKSEASDLRPHRAHYDSHRNGLSVKTVYAVSCKEHKNICNK